MESIPRYSYDLIDELDKAVVAPKLPVTATNWHALNENAMRMAAFQSGMRSVVDMLVEMRAEIEKEKADARSEHAPAVVDDTEDPLGQVLDPDGNPHQTVASTHLAARLVDPLPDGGGDR